MFKTGLGMDAHRLVPGRRLVIGGVEIPAEVGSLGHSDGDVLLHAMTDAILGAAALGDIGHFFPSTDTRWQGADSRIFLSAALQAAREAGYELLHLDGTVILEQPRLSGHIAAMRRTIAAALEVEIDRISIKATTTDGLGFCGAGRGLAALAVATLQAP